MDGIQKGTTLVVPKRSESLIEYGLQPLGLGKMAKPSHLPTSHRTFFATSTTWERRALFHSERMARLFHEVLVHYRKERKYLLHEFVLMADHFHVLLTLDEAVTIERAVQFIKGGFSFRAKRELGVDGEIWQRGFTEHIVRDSGDSEHHREYILGNPVKAGLVRKAEEYPYSSAYPGLELDPPPEGFRG
jgi:REP-associated tyrosine transposase